MAFDHKPHCPGEKPRSNRACLCVQVLLDAGFLTGRAVEHSSLRHVIAAHSQHAHEPALVKAVLVAGLYPNVAVTWHKKRHCSVRTRSDGKVEYMPDSVLWAPSECAPCSAAHPNLQKCTPLQENNCTVEGWMQRTAAMAAAVAAARACRCGRSSALLCGARMHAECC